MEQLGNQDRSKTCFFQQCDASGPPSQMHNRFRRGINTYHCRHRPFCVMDVSSVCLCDAPFFEAQARHTLDNVTFVRLLHRKNICARISSLCCDSLVCTAFCRKSVKSDVWSFCSSMGSTPNYIIKLVSSLIRIMVFGPSHLITDERGRRRR